MALPSLASAAKQQKIREERHRILPMLPSRRSSAAEQWESQEERRHISPLPQNRERPGGSVVSPRCRRRFVRETEVAFPRLVINYAMGGCHAGTKRTELGKLNRYPDKSAYLRTYQNCDWRSGDTHVACTLGCVFDAGYVRYNVFCFLACFDCIGSSVDFL